MTGGEASKDDIGAFPRSTEIAPSQSDLTDRSTEADPVRSPAHDCKSTVYVALPTGRRFASTSPGQARYLDPEPEIRGTRNSNMDQLIDSFELHSPPALAEPTPSAAWTGLPLRAMEHGAYYAGKLGVTTTVARWHTKKQRFVFQEFNLGRQRVRSVAHFADDSPEERFVPIARIEPKNNQRLSDYAFETGS